MSTDHLAKAREYIAKGDDFYAKAATEIAAAKDERPELTWVEIGRQLDRSPDWVSTLVMSFRKAERARDDFEVDWRSGSNKRDEVAQKVFRDPEQRKQIIAAMPSEQIEDLIGEANEVAVDRARAQRAEHDTSTKAPTTGDLMGAEKFDPSESWADTLVIRANRNLRELAGHTDRWGLVLGSMPIEEAFSYAQETERLAAEFRAAVQERLRDHAEV